MQAHTFLLHEGTWRAEGEFSDGGSNRFAVAGESSVRHEAARWLFESALRIRSEPPRVQANRYEIEPFKPGARSTHWTSHNAAIGALAGRFVIAGDAILSFYTSPTGRYRGFECLLQRDAARYSARGALLEEDKVISTWSLELTHLQS